MKEQFKLDDREIIQVGWDTEGGYELMRVGSKHITKIDCSEQFLGEYSIIWIQVWSNDDLLARFNARNVDAILYKDEV